MAFHSAILTSDTEFERAHRRCSAQYAHEYNEWYGLNELDYASAQLLIQGHRAFHLPGLGRATSPGWEIMFDLSIELLEIVLL